MQLYRLNESFPIYIINHLNICDTFMLRRSVSIVACVYYQINRHKTVPKSNLADIINWLLSAFMMVKASTSKQ